MSDEGKKPAGGISARALGVALIISLCLNLLIIGAGAMLLWRIHETIPARMGAGAVALPPPVAADGQPPRWGHDKWHGSGHGKGRGMAFGLGRGPLNPHMLMAAVPQKADAIRAVLEAHRDTLDGLRDQALTARFQAGKVLAADDYTPARFDAALEAVRAADVALEAEVLKTVAECANLLTPEERRAVLSKGLHKRGRWHRRD